MLPRQASGMMKRLWTKVRQNIAELQAGLAKKRYRGLDKPLINLNFYAVSYPTLK